MKLKLIANATLFFVNSIQFVGATEYFKGMIGDVPVDNFSPLQLREFVKENEKSNQHALMEITGYFVEKQRTDLLNVLFSASRVGESVVVYEFQKIAESAFKDRLLIGLMREDWSIDNPLLKSGGLPSANLITPCVGIIERHLPGVLDGTNDRDWIVTHNSRMRLAAALEKALRGETVNVEIEQLAKGGPLLPGEMPGLFGSLRLEEKAISLPDSNAPPSSIDERDEFESAQEGVEQGTESDQTRTNSGQCLTVWMIGIAAICGMAACVYLWKRINRR